MASPPYETNRAIRTAQVLPQRRRNTEGKDCRSGHVGGRPCTSTSRRESCHVQEARGAVAISHQKKKVILASRLVLENSPQNRLQLRSVKKNSSTSESQSRLIRGKRIRWPCNWCTGSSTAKTPAQIPYIRFRALMLRYSLIIRSVKSFGDVSISITPDSRSMAA